MFNFRSPLNMFEDELLPGSRPQSRAHAQQQMMLSPFDSMRQMMHTPFGGLGGGMFGGAMFGDMFSQMNSMMQQMQNPEMLGSQLSVQNGAGPMFAQSSVYSYSSNGQGAPQIYQATNSVRQGPGGVRETRRAVRDTARQREQMSIGHHIGQRSHVIERSRDMRTGDQDENQEFVNLAEEEAEDFDREFRGRLQQGASRSDRRLRLDGQRHSPYGSRGQRAIEYPQGAHQSRGTGSRARSARQ